MKVLSIGGNGNYAGLATGHLATKHDVTVFDIKDTPCGFSCRQVVGNVTKLEQVIDAAKGMDAIVTFVVGSLELSAIGILNILTAAEAAHVPHVVYMSSGGLAYPAAAFGAKHPVYSMKDFSVDFWRNFFPMREAIGIFPGQENTPYFHNKWLCEEMGRHFAARGKVAFTAIRPGLLMRDDMTNFREGEVKRNFDPFMMLMTGHIRMVDIANLIDLSLKKRPAGFEAFYGSNDTVYNNLSVEKARTVLGYKTQDQKPYLDLYQNDKMDYKTSFAALTSGGFPAEVLRKLHAFKNL